MEWKFSTFYGNVKNKEEILSLTTGRLAVSIFKVSSLKLSKGSHRLNFRISFILALIATFSSSTYEPIYIIQPPSFQCLSWKNLQRLVGKGKGEEGRRFYMKLFSKSYIYEKKKRPFPFPYEMY